MASSTNIKAHQSTYEGFISLVKYGTPAVLLITALVMFLITR